MAEKTFPLFGSEIKLSTDLPRYTAYQRMYKRKKAAALQLLEQCKSTHDSPERICQLLTDMLESDAKRIIAELERRNDYSQPLSWFLFTDGFGAAVRIYNSPLFRRDEPEQLRYMEFIKRTAKEIGVAYDRMNDRHMSCVSLSSMHYRGVEWSHSSDLLENLDAVQRKSEVIVRALRECPLNPDVYLTVIDRGYVTHELIDIIKFVGLSDELVEKLEQSKHLLDSDVTRPSAISSQYYDTCTVIASLNNEPAAETLQRYFPKAGETVRQQYRDYVNAQDLAQKNVSLFYDCYLKDREDVLDEYESSGNIQLFLERCTASKNDLEALEACFGDTAVFEDVSSIIGCPATDDYAVLMAPLSENAKQLADAAVSRRNSIRAEEEYKREQETRARKKAEERRKNVDNVCAYAAGISFFCTLIFAVAGASNLNDEAFGVVAMLFLISLVVFVVSAIGLFRKD